MDAAKWHQDAKFTREKKTHERCLKTESCCFNYGLSALSPIGFLTHSSANLVINQSRVARSCSLAPSLSLPCSLRALAPLVCSPAPPVCAFLIGFGLELVSSGCSQHRFHTASFGCGEGRRYWRRRRTCLCLSGLVHQPARMLYGYFCAKGVWGRYGDGAARLSCPVARCSLLCRFPFRVLLVLCIKVFSCAFADALRKHALLPVPHLGKPNLQGSWETATPGHAARELPGSSLLTPVPGEDTASPKCQHNTQRRQNAPICVADGTGTGNRGQGQ